MIARVSFNTACELGFRGSLDEWERLNGGSREAMNDFVRFNHSVRGQSQQSRMELGLRFSSDQRP